MISRAGIWPLRLAGVARWKAWVFYRAVLLASDRW